jgi:hypothetical protein
MRNKSLEDSMIVDFGMVTPTCGNHLQGSTSTCKYGFLHPLHFALIPANLLGAVTPLVPLPLILMLLVMMMVLLSVVDIFYG